MLELPEDCWSGSGRKSVALPSGLYLPAFRQTSWLSDKNKDKFKRLLVLNANTNSKAHLSSGASTKTLGRLPVWESLKIIGTDEDTDKENDKVK